MTFELICDILLSLVVVYVYHTDCKQQLALACDSVPLYAPVEYAPRRFVTPEDYEVVESFTIEPGTPWVTDPMETGGSIEDPEKMEALLEAYELAQFEAEDLSLAQLFALADAIEPMGPEVAAELTQLDTEVDQLCPAVPIEAQPRKATAPQLKVLLKAMGLSVVGKKAELAERVLNALAERGLSQYPIADSMYESSSADDLSITVRYYR